VVGCLDDGGVAESGKKSSKYRSRDAAPGTSLIAYLPTLPAYLTYLGTYSIGYTLGGAVDTFSSCLGISSVSSDQSNPTYPIRGCASQHLNYIHFLVGRSHYLRDNAQSTGGQHLAVLSLPRWTPYGPPMDCSCSCRSSSPGMHQDRHNVTTYGCY